MIGMIYYWHDLIGMIYDWYDSICYTSEYADNFTSLLSGGPGSNPGRGKILSLHSARLLLYNQGSNHRA